MFTLSPDAFEQLLSEAFEELPEVFRARLDNVVIVVEEYADARTLRSVGLRHPAQLLGLYHGVPLTARPHDYGLVTPDRISIYRQPILMQCANLEQVRALVGRVLRHEIAHYFGIDDNRLEELDAY
jgi:predicted Zn-dependent protease with MMP-like domain